MDAETRSALIEAYRTLIHQLPEGTEVNALRQDGERTAVVTVTSPDGRTTRYETKKK